MRMEGRFSTAHPPSTHRGKKEDIRQHVLSMLSGVEREGGGERERGKDVDRQDQLPRCFCRLSEDCQPDGYDVRYDDSNLL